MVWKRSGDLISSIGAGVVLEVPLRKGFSVEVEIPDFAKVPARVMRKAGKKVFLIFMLSGIDTRRLENFLSPDGLIRLFCHPGDTLIFFLRKKGRIFCAPGKIPLAFQCDIGSMTVKAVPCSSTLSTRIVPLWASMIDLTMANPRPVPWISLVFLSFTR